MVTTVHRRLPPSPPAPPPACPDYHPRIPPLTCRVMKALSDVSVQRRKLESTVASVSARSAAANARLAQDSRDSAAALLAELRARREASKQHQQKQKSSQQQHGGSAAEGAPIQAMMVGRASNVAATGAAPAAAKPKAS